MSESNVARLVVRHRLVWALVALLLIGLAVWWFAGSRTSIPEKKAGYAAGATPPVPVKIEIAKVLPIQEQPGGRRGDKEQCYNEW